MSHGSVTVHRHWYNHKLDMTLRSTITTRHRLYNLCWRQTNFMCTEFPQHACGCRTTNELLAVLNPPVHVNIFNESGKNMSKLPIPRA